MSARDMPHPSLDRFNTIAIKIMGLSCFNAQHAILAAGTADGVCKRTGSKVRPKQLCIVESHEITKGLVANFCTNRMDELF